jgi:hypothetical protein
MTHSIEKFIINRISEVFTKYNIKKIKLNYITTEEEDGHVYYIVRLLGGENGHGRFSNYLEDVKHIIDAFDHAWLINWTNDCLDDLWKLEFGIKL